MCPSHRPRSNRCRDVAVAEVIVASPFRARIMPRRLRRKIRAGYQTRQNTNGPLINPDKYERSASSFWRDNDPLATSNTDAAPLHFDFELSWTSVAILRR